jgi:uncharacterized membrane protein
MKRRARSIVLCLVLQAGAAEGQQTGGRFGGSNWGAAPTAAAPPPPSYAPPPPMPPTPAPAVAPPVAMPVAPPAPPPTAIPAVPAPMPVAPPAPPPSAVRVRVTGYRRPPPRELPLSTATPTRAYTDAEYQLTHPQIDYTPRYGPARAGAGAATAAALFGLGALLSVRLTRGGAARRSPVRPPMPGHAPGPAPHPGVEVRRVSVALDWGARAAIQHGLAQVSATVDTGTPQGLHAAASRARDALAGAHRAARYAAFQSWSLDPARGQGVFGQVADSLRGRYTVETVDHARRVAAPKTAARREEGEGLVVVTLLVAAKGPLAPLPAALDLPALMAALDGIVPARPDLLAALEVVWSPAEEGDRLSSAELEALYPELARLDAAAALGRRACGSCRAVYAGELGRCPACGGV